MLVIKVQIIKTGGFNFIINMDIIYILKKINLTDYNSENGK